MNHLSRRQFVQSLVSTSVVGWGLARSTAVLAERPEVREVAGEPTAAIFNWPSRSIQLPTAPGETKPPVVTAVRIHSDGQWLASAGDDHVVRVWNLSDGTLFHRLVEHSDWVRTIDYSPNGKTLVSSGNDRRILLWEAESGKLMNEIGHHDAAVAHVRFSPNGKYLAVVCFEGHLHLYDVEQGTHVRQMDAPCDDMRTVTFSPDSQILASGGRCGTIRLQAVETGETIRDVAAHKQRIRAISFSPDGKFIASSGEDRVVHVLPLAEMAAGYRLPTRPVKFLSLVFYGNRQLAAAGSDNLIRLWDVSDRQEIGLLSGHTGSVAALDCLGKMLVSAGYDTTVRIWTITDNIAGDAISDEKRVGALPGKKLD